MSDKSNGLADYIRKVIKEKDLNYRLVAERSGGLISHSTVYDIINHRSKNPTAQTIHGLALGLGVTEEELMSVARGAQPNPDSVASERFDKLRFTYHNEIPRENREKADVLLDLMEREYQRLKGSK